MLLPLQGEHYRITIPRVPASLRAAFALGYDLVGLSARCLAAHCADLPGRNIPENTKPRPIDLGYYVAPFQGLQSRSKTCFEDIRVAKHGLKGQKTIAQGRGDT